MIKTEVKQCNYAQTSMEKALGESASLKNKLFSSLSGL